MVTWCTTRFNVQKFYVLPTQCMYAFCMARRTKGDYLHIIYWRASVCVCVCVCIYIYIYIYIYLKVHDLHFFGAHIACISRYIQIIFCEDESSSSLLQVVSVHMVHTLDLASCAVLYRPFIKLETIIEMNMRRQSLKWIYVWDLRFLRPRSRRFIIYGMFRRIDW
jgi:hypothetical protein